MMPYNNDCLEQVQLHFSVYFVSCLSGEIEVLRANRLSTHDVISGSSPDSLHQSIKAEIIYSLGIEINL